MVQDFGFFDLNIGFSTKTPTIWGDQAVGQNNLPLVLDDDDLPVPYTYDKVGLTSPGMVKVGKQGKMEKEQGFVEGMIDSKTKKEIQFFNSGIERDWKKLLSDKIVNKIELSFKKEMTELGYL